MGNLSHLKKAKVIYAFPGHGKTPFAQQNVAPFVDLDFGFFRLALKVEKANEKVLYKAYARLLTLYVDEGFKVLSNSPETIPYVKALLPGTKIIMVLPEDLSYSANKMAVSEEEVAEWVKGWADIAAKYGISVYYTPKSFDKFMRSMVY